MRLRPPLLAIGAIAGLFVLAWTQRQRFTPVDIGSRYRVHGSPTTFVIDRQARIVYKLQGAREWDDPHYSEMFEKLLADS